GILFGEPHGDLDGFWVPPCLCRHLPELGDHVGNLGVCSARGLWDPALAIADCAPCRIRERATNDDRRVWLLPRFWPGHHRIEVDELAVVFGLRLSPDRLHRLDTFPRQLVAAGEGGAVVLHLVAVPAVANTEQKASAGHLINRR